MNTPPTKVIAFAVSAWLTLAAPLLAVAPDETTEPLDAAAVIAQAKKQLDQGRLIAAKRLLTQLSPRDVSSEEQDRVARLLARVERRLHAADPLEVSLQKAEAALEEHDLRQADRHAQAVLQARKATAAQRERASTLLDRVARERAAFAPLVADALTRAEQAAAKSDWAAARSEIDAVLRSGVRLDEQAQLRLNRVRDLVLAATDRTPPAQTLPPAAAFAQAMREDEPPQPAKAKQDQGEKQPQSKEQPAGEQQPQQSPEELFKLAKQFDAQRLLREADAAFDAGRLNEALEKYSALAGEYRDALTEEQQQRVDRRIGEVRTLLNQPNLLEQEQRLRQITREEALAEFNNLLSQANDALAQGDVDRARQLVSEARVRITQAQDLFSEQEFTNLLNTQQQALTRINTTEEQIRQREAEQRARELERQQREREQAQLRERQRKINENLDRIRELQAEQKYEEALQLVDQVLFLDPQNPAGLLLKDVLEDVIIYREWERTQRDKQLSYAKQTLENQRSLVAPEGVIEYPPDWPELSVRRGEPQSFVESPADRRVLAELDSKRIPASFTDNSLEDVLNFFATVTNLNVDVDWESLANIGVDRDTPITLNLQPVPARVVLDRVLEKASPDAFSKAGWAVNDGVLVVASDEALRRNTFIVIYDVRDLTFGIRDAVEAPQIDLNNVLNQAQSGGGGSSGSIFSGNEEVTTEGLTQEELLDLIEDIIKQSVDPEGWRDAGGDTGSIMRFNGNLIITNTAKNHRKIAALLKQLREIRSI
ncbi:MAG: hypothetical protein D6824_08210, partial [Planctomycetota bacterium]